MLLIDKYKITSKDDIIFNQDIYNKLLKKSTFNTLPNLLIHGPSGCGKKTLIRLLLQEIYGIDVNNIRKETYSIIGYGNTNIDIEIEQSNYHLIIEPNNSGFDKYLIQEIVNEYAKRKLINITNNIKYKIVLINNVDNLSYYAQTSLRCTMERYYQTCKFILCGYQVSKIIEPLKSRCLIVRIPRPSNIDILELLAKIALKEKFKPSFKTLNKIIRKCENNPKNAIWMLELYKNYLKLGKPKNMNKYDDFELSWKNYLTPIVDIIYNSITKKNITLHQITEIRNIINVILITNISGTDIIIELMKKIINYQPSYPDILLYDIIETISEFEKRLSKGKRSIIHLESLIISLLNITISYNQ